MQCSKCGGERDRPGQAYCRACHAAYQREHRPRHSELADEQRKKANARAYAKEYQKRGLLVPGPCEECGTTEGVEKHHDDYDKPLEVRWFCRKHHMALHY